MVSGIDCGEFEPLICKLETQFSMLPEGKTPSARQAFLVGYYLPAVTGVILGAQRIILRFQSETKNWA